VQHAPAAVTPAAHCYDLRSRNDQVTWGHVVGTRLKRSVKAARLKQKLLFQPIRLTIELNTKSELKALTSVPIYPSILQSAHTAQCDQFLKPTDHPDHSALCCYRRCPRVPLRIT